MSDWVQVAARDQVDADNPLGVVLGATAIGVFDVEGELHAIEDLCPHAAANLSQGFTEGCEVECPLHGAVFDVRSGKHLRGELCRDLRTFAGRVVGDQIQLCATGDVNDKD